MKFDNEEQTKIIYQMLEATTGSNKPANIKAMYDFIISLEKAEIEQEDTQKRLNATN